MINWFDVPSESPNKDLTLKNLKVSENGTYGESGAAYSSVEVDVSGGGGGGSSDFSTAEVTVINNATNESVSKKADAIIETASGSIASFTDGGDDLPMKSLKVSIEPKQSGSGDPSPDNIRPISGWSGVNIEQRGKNLCNPALNSGLLATTIGGIETNVITSNRYGYTERIDSTNALTVSATTSNANNFDWFKVMQYVDGVVVWVSSDKSFEDTPGTITIDIPARANSYIRIAVGSKSGYGVGSSINGNVQTEIGNTATEYEPYQGESKYIPFKDENGDPITVYGGEIDVVSGLLKSYPFYSSYNGETLSGEWICDRAVYSQGTTPPIGSQVVDMSGNGTEYQLDPTEIRTLKGVNNVWADTGDTEAEYRADTTLAFEKLKNAIISLGGNI